jgi:integrase
MFFSWISWTGNMDLSRIGRREALKPKIGDEPHWQRLRAGCYLGFRPSKKGGKGTWFARVYDPDVGKYVRKALGEYGSLTGNDVFSQARRDAEAWSDQVESGGIVAEQIKTVSDACRAYLKEKPGLIAAGVFRRHVFDDPIGKQKLERLRRRHLREWRQRLENAPALLSRNKGGITRTKPRSVATINRDIVPLRAALGRILSPGTPNTDAAWQEALKPTKGADKRRDLYLDRTERRRLLDAASEDILPWMEALCLLPLRPGALAALKVKDFDGRIKTLTIGKDKSGQPRQIAIPDNIVRIISEQVKGMPRKATIFRRADGRAWNKDSWNKPVKEAVIKAGLPSEVTAYTLRHCVITDLVNGGLPILTVAQISDTSVAMIEAHYGHLVAHAATEALARLAL